MRQPDQWVVIALLGGFECTVDGEAVALSLGAQRLLAFLSLESAGAHRSRLAQLLWPHASESRAAANLRSALWQVRRSPAEPALCSIGPRLRLHQSVSVDLHTVARQLPQAPDRAGCAPSPRSPSDPPDARALGDLRRRLRRDLLSGWDDDWLTLERERWHSARLRAFEALSENLLHQGAFHAAHDAALEAVALEPLRESAHRLVVEVHLAEGNPASALRHYRRYRATLHGELGVAPSTLMEGLVRPLVLGDLGGDAGRELRPGRGASGF